jgi:hypothetical protein
VILASRRECVVRELAEQALDGGLTKWSAPSSWPGRTGWSRRLAAQEALLIDAEPARLLPDLANRFHAVKRAALLL